MNEADYIFWDITGMLVCAFIGCLIGNSKNRKRLGLYLGATLGPIGWIVMLFVDEVAPGETGNGLAIALISTAIPVALVFGLSTFVKYKEVQSEQIAFHQAETAAARPVISAPPLPATPAPIARSHPTPMPEADPAKVRASILQKYGAAK